MQEIVLRGILATFVLLNYMINLPCTLFGLVLLYASTRKDQFVSAEVAVARGAGEDKFKSSGCHSLNSC